MALRTGPTLNRVTAHADVKAHNHQSYFVKDSQFHEQGPRAFCTTQAVDKQGLNERRLRVSLRLVTEIASFI